MQPPTSFSAMIKQIDAVAEDFTRLLPHLDAAEVLLPTDQVLQLHWALARLASLVAGPQSRLFVESIVRDERTRKAILQLLSTNYVPLLDRRVPDVDVVLRENLIVIFVLRGNFHGNDGGDDEETDDDTEDAQNGRILTQALRKAHPAALLAWSLYCSPGTWTSMRIGCFFPVFDRFREHYSYDNLPEYALPAMKRVATQYPLSANADFLRFVERIVAEREAP
ncbi:hypothetical protein ISF_08075 [Cordyceps fumosorosea ARSEF 2679]|uniref:Uncharacterized protein n=1 Tax=Cordyceps fumosorosea (strain ARSEF 2679) TaxID=1081104 RepID=A0A167N5K8_CORFA|nr:hypothetical protein ISF_08075 [Cordyceps fumosorosea ARSEF 2679]OAA55154.1 hypothetical protein ISF_08075 [Cordyceps fumosorosea ARSEF 2679]